MTKTPKFLATRCFGGQATLEKHGTEHFSKMGKTPCKNGKRGRPRWIGIND